MIQNQLYKQEVYTAKGERVSNKELERQFYAASKDALSNINKQPSIGLLTAGPRDNWAFAHEILKERNAQNLKLIHESLFVLCLDDYATNKNLDKSHRQFFHNENAQNRWFDKTIQLIVANNGRAGVNGEHSPADAVIPGRIFQYVIEKFANLTQ